MIDLKGKTISFNSHVKFEEVEEDERISKVTLKMCHDGINANYSEIDLEVLKRDIEKSINESKIGVPILADFKNGDFDTHTSDERVIGSIVPQYSDLYFEYDEKYDRTFAFSTGYIWNYYSQNAIDILEDDKNHQRAVSIEAQVLDGEYDKQRRVYRIKEFVLIGITILALKVKEGMTGSKITLDYSLDSLNETIKEVLTNKLESNDNTILNNKNTENKESEDNMAFNKKEFALKFGLTAIQLAEEFSKACRSMKYMEEYWGEQYECTKYGFRDYDDTYMYAMDYECGHMVGVKYTFEGDMPKVDFENSIRMKTTYTPFDMGGEVEETEVEEFSSKSFVEDIKTKSEFANSKVEDLENKITEFENNKVIDKPSEVEELKGRVSEYERQIGEKDQTILDLGFKYESLEKEKKEIDEKLNDVESKIAEFEAKTSKEKAQELFNKVSEGLSKEENDNLSKEIENIKDEETFKVFELKVKDLALARFSLLASKQDNLAKFHRTPVVPEIIEDTKDESKSVWERLEDNIKK